jgi:CheY-like chemotaxis protein
VAETITSVANLLWPLTVLLLILIFRGQLRHVIRSAGQREVSLEVGGQKITLGELSQAQNATIADLQKQVASLQDALGDHGTGDKPTIPSEPIEPSAPFTVLWVDDHPENNVLQIAQLRDNGVRVDLAHTTQEGVGLFSRHRYRMVISDMDRTENGIEVADAGVRLVAELRTLDPAIPIVIYCGTRAMQALGDRAIVAGASAVTDSPYEMSEHFRALALL